MDVLIADWAQTEKMDLWTLVEASCFLAKTNYSWAKGLINQSQMLHRAVDSLQRILYASLKQKQHQL